MRDNAILAGSVIAEWASGCVVANNTFGAGDGIKVYNTGSAVGGNTIRLNTSVEHAGCDLNGVGAPPRPDTWENNRFVNPCGNAGG